MAKNRGRPGAGLPGQGRELLPPGLVLEGWKVSGPGRRAVGREEISGGRLRRSSGRSPPKAKMAALSCANSGSSRLEQAESASGTFGIRDGFAAVGRAGGFFCVPLGKKQILREQKGKKKRSHN